MSLGCLYGWLNAAVVATVTGVVCFRVSEGGGALSGALIQTHGEHSIDSPSFPPSLFVWVVLNFLGQASWQGFVSVPSYFLFLFLFSFSGEREEREEGKSHIHTRNMGFKLKTICEHTKDLSQFNLHCIDCVRLLHLSSVLLSEVA